ACSRHPSTATTTQPKEPDELADVSFRLPLHQGRLDPSGAHWLDDPPDVMGVASVQGGAFGHAQWAWRTTPARTCRPGPSRILCHATIRIPASARPVRRRKAARAVVGQLGPDRMGGWDGR